MSLNSLGRRDEDTVEIVVVGYESEHERGCAEADDDESLLKLFEAVVEEQKIKGNCVGGRKCSLGEHEKHNDANDEKLEIRRQVPTLLQALNENLIDELITLIYQPVR